MSRLGGKIISSWLVISECWISLNRKYLCYSNPIIPFKHPPPPPLRQLSKLARYLRAVLVREKVVGYTKKHYHTWFLQLLSAKVFLASFVSTWSFSKWNSLFPVRKFFIETNKTIVDSSEFNVGREN